MCLEAGWAAGRGLETCIFDVAVTGQEEFASAQAREFVEGQNVRAVASNSPDTADLAGAGIHLAAGGGELSEYRPSAAGAAMVVFVPAEVGETVALARTRSGGTSINVTMVDPEGRQSTGLLSDTFAGPIADSAGLWRVEFEAPVADEKFLVGALAVESVHDGPIAALNMRDNQLRAFAVPATDNGPDNAAHIAISCLGVEASASQFSITGEVETGTVLARIPLSWDRDWCRALGVSGSGLVLLSTVEPEGDPVGSVTPLSAGLWHTVAVASNGDVYGWGYNYEGQLGDATPVSIWSEVKIDFPGPVASISAGERHTMAITEAGQLYALGLNDTGQLGDGTRDDRRRAVRVDLSGSVKQVSAGQDHTVAVTQSGQVYAWGLNDRGQLGDGSTVDRLTPVRVDVPVAVTSVSAGRRHTVAVTQDGQVYAWGANSGGELGVGSTTDRSAPVLVDVPGRATSVSAGTSHSLVLTSDGHVYGWGANTFGWVGDGSWSPQLTPARLEIPGTVISLSLTRDHALAVVEGGDLYGWGSGANYKLGDGTLVGSATPRKIEVPSPVAVATAGAEHSLVMTEAGTVYAWGYNQQGQLAVPGSTNVTVPTRSGITDVLSGSGPGVAAGSG